MRRQCYDRPARYLRKPVLRQHRSVVRCWLGSWRQGQSDPKQELPPRKLYLKRPKSYVPNLVTSSASAPHYLQPRCFFPSDLLFASFQLLMHLVCRSENIQRERALLYAVAPDAPAACHILYDDLGRADFRMPLRPSGTSRHFSEKRRSQNPDGIASRAPNRPIGLIPDRRQSRRQALRNNQESPRNPACANWAIASIPLPISLLTTIAWKARKHPGHLPQRT